MKRLSRFYPQVIHKLRITYVNVDITGFVACGKVTKFFEIIKIHTRYGKLDLLHYIYSGSRWKMLENKKKVQVLLDLERFF